MKNLLDRSAHRPLSRFAPPIFGCWAAAIVTAIASLILYRKKPRPWFVWINLPINVSGLLFTLWIVLMMIAHSF